MSRAAALGAALIGLVLNGCDGEAPSDGQAPAAPPSDAFTAAPSPAPSATVARQSGAPALLPEAEKGETGARNVLLEWARDLERGDFDGAYSLWLDGARSGMTRAEHATYWSRFETVTIAAPTGEMEGAAGSSYYTAPVSVIGKQQNGHPYRLEGTVVLRRVNDVPGATPAQLRWHVEAVDLQPAT